MASGSERRSKRRLVVGPEVSLHFQVQTVVYQEVSITNLSADGCFATLPRAGNPLFQQGTLLENFGFNHPDLKGEPMLARVAYVLGGGGGGRGGLELMGLGIHFSAGPILTGRLAAFIRSRN